MNTSPLLLGLGLAVVGLLPFALVVLTSFVKMAVVLSIARSAIGAPQVPPNSVVTGLALVLSLTAMAPVATEVAGQLEADAAVFESGAPAQWLAAAGRAAQPVRGFLLRNTDPAQLCSLAEAVEGRPLQADEGPSWRVLVPAFVIDQLHQAFRVGFAIFVPFLVIDMLVASVLLSLGMHMLSPTAVSLPFKLLVFALADGWRLIGVGLLGGVVA